MKVSNFDVKAVATLDDVKRFLSQTVSQIATILNSKITFVDNFDSRSVDVTFSSPAIDVAVDHNLGRLAISYIPQMLSTPMIIYTGQTAPNGNTIYLRSSAAGTATIMVS